MRWRRTNTLPTGWRVFDGRDPEKELGRLRGWLGRVSKRYFSALELRRQWRRVSGVVVVGGAGAAFYLGLMSLSPWPQLQTLQHLAAFPNCAAARAVGLAPARRGQPGYYDRLDLDNDGWACEPWPNR